MRTKSAKALLFLSHFDPGSNLEPMWVFPGGQIEPGESPLDCALREIFEETGLIVNHFDLAPLQTIHHSMPDPREFQTGEAHFFDLLIEEPFEPKRDHWTAEEVRDTVSMRWWSAHEILSERPWIGPDGAIDILLSRLA